MTTDGRAEQVFSQRRDGMMNLNVDGLLLNEAPAMSITPTPAAPVLPLQTSATVPPTLITQPPPGLRIAQPGKPWAMVRWTLGAVLLLYFIEQLVLVVALLSIEGYPVEGALVLVISVPFMVWFAQMMKPRLLHMRLITHDSDGRTVHALRDGSLIVTPLSSKMAEHLVRDERPLDLPAGRTLWAGFVATVIAGLLIAALWAFGMTENSSSDGVLVMAVLLAMLLAGPAWLAGFSLPVLAWVSSVTHRLRIVLAQREVAMMLVLGMLSTLPAIIINTGFPILISGLITVNETILEVLTAVISAPIGEELFKGFAVWTQRKRLRSHTHAFLVGFLVGLGFAILENLQYVLISMGGGPLTFSFTTLIRGIGSIPGHGLWTGMTALGIAHNRFSHDVSAPQDTENDSPEWVLFDERTGEQINAQSFMLKEIEPLNVDEIPNWWPKSMAHGIALAMLGHAFWNGSASVPLLLPAGVDVMASLLISICLVSIVLTIGRSILNVLSGNGHAESVEGKPWQTSRLL